MSPQQIRERIMKPDSEFQQALIKYLESCHIGQFQTVTLDEVQENLNERSNSFNYKDLTTVLPTLPPKKCDNECNNCVACNANRLWWEEFPQVVDEIVLKSNVHKCGAKCMNNKFKMCRARFPRDIVENTEIDSYDGSIKMKKLEQWINFISPPLTYLIRCNSDVTSLLSGTAIKAIVAYVTDYITKAPLKTHTMFDAIRTVFDRKSELINGNKSREEKSRKLITNIVNSLTSSMEIGGPMASLYLLGNPDHYTNYKFRHFYWKPYVNYNWREYSYNSENVSTENIENEDNILLLKSKSEYISYNPILDYIYRPSEYADICLYDWIRRFDKVKVHKRKLQLADDNELNDYNVESMQQPAVSSDKCESNQEINKILSEDYSEDELDIISKDSGDNIVFQNKSKGLKSELNDRLNKRYDFLPEHPQYKTHTVKLLSEDKAFVPNFVSPIPRSDTGDREYYCATMMTLFKPWRHSDNLKQKNKTWDESFFLHKFTKRQTELMYNFNIRYECHDAKDDYRLQRKKKLAAKDIPPWMNDNFIKESNQEADTQDVLADYVSHNATDYDNPTDDIDDLTVTGRNTINRQIQITQMQRVLRAAGWMERSQDGYEKVLSDDNPENEIIYSSSNSWQNLLTEKRKQILRDRLKQLPEKQANKLYLHHSKHTDQVNIVGKEYLSENCSSIQNENNNQINKIIADFTLNEEQERAFRIVAQHACLPYSEQLKMYLGGMGGTGKSQVIKALMHFFRQRNEPHRFTVLAPTGSAAVLVDGSTYHSVLGVFEVDKDITKTIAQIKDRLEGVEYIFVDEVSMISCRDIYTISKQLALSLNNKNDAFGGMNIIFAGDFAQLPPVMSKSLYAHEVGTSAKSSMSIFEQECDFKAEYETKVSVS